MSTLFYIIVILCGSIGLTLTDYIHRKKIAGEKLKCPTGSNCEVVIYSKYSTYLGLPVENWGGVYYLTIILSYGFLLFFPKFASDLFSFTILFITTLAFIFSVYLTYAQIMVLKEWCIWCIFSAILCTIIFIMVWSGTELNLIEFLNTIVTSAFKSVK